MTEVVNWGCKFKPWSVEEIQVISYWATYEGDPYSFVMAKVIFQAQIPTQHVREELLGKEEVLQKSEKLRLRGGNKVTCMPGQIIQRALSIPQIVCNIWNL